jgi:hypothetical protein
MSTLLAALSLLRLGIYTPETAPPFQSIWFYGSVQVYEQKAKYPLGAELGVAPEFRQVSNDVLGLSGTKYIVKPAYMAGLTKQINPDLNLAVGVKYGEYVRPYVGLSLRFDSVIKATQRENDHGLLGR